MEQEKRNKERAAERRIALMVACLSSFLTPFMGSATNIALPSIGREFQASAIILGWVATAYSLTAAMILVPMGRVADIYGRKRVFISGLAIHTFGSWLASSTPSMALLLIARVIQGIGSAMIFGTGVAILTSIFPPNQRGRVLGINVSFTYLGLTLGPILGGVLTQNFSWRSIFLFNSLIGLVAFVSALLGLKGEWAEARGERLDLKGAFIYSLSLVFLISGFSRLPTSFGFILSSFGLLGLFIFLWWESKVPSPLLNLHLFRQNRLFAFSNLAALIHYSATAAVSLLLSLYLQYIKGMSPRTAGFVLVAQPFLMALFSPLAGRISDRIEPRLVASTGMALSSLGLFGLIFLEAESSIQSVVASLAFLGFGFALFSSPNTNAVMGSVERKFYGLASSTLATMRLIGQMMSLGTVMILFSLFIGPRAIEPAIYPVFLRSAHVGFIVFALLCSLGVAASLARGRRSIQR
ncbi:MAG: MFS transporter [Candidatus Aminicenantes bacterium]|nr:MFS transporter [Candidatus Aminicenantes bacterium]